MRSTSTLAFATGLLGQAEAFWRMECPGRVGMARIDPLVNPGVPATHAHSISGSSGLTETSTTDDLMAANCTSCLVTDDMSAYWHPGLYFEDEKTGEFELVEQVGGMLAYYFLNGDNIKAFPKNFQMLSGDTNRREYTLGDPNEADPEKSIWSSLGQTKQSDLAQRAIGFNCLNYARDPEGTLYRHKMPEKEFLDANCADGIRLEIMFPSCWNGEDVTSANHKDHVAFPDLVNTGTCPDDFPVRLPGLMYEVIWNTAAYTSRNGRFVLANGDVTGYGYHADFMSGWEPTLLQQAVNTCTNPSGRIYDCPVFNIVEESVAKQCSLNQGMRIMSEDTSGPLDFLPGKVAIIGEGGSDDSDDGLGGLFPAPSSTSSKATASMSYVPGDLPTDPANPLPGQVFKESGLGEESASPTTSTPPAETSPDSAVQVAAVPAAAADDAAVVQEAAVEESPTPTPEPEVPEPEPSVSFYSTEYITNGVVVSKILWEEKLVTITESIDASTTVTVDPAPTDAPRRRHLLAHRGHRHI